MSRTLNLPLTDNAILKAARQSCTHTTSYFWLLAGSELVTGVFYPAWDPSAQQALPLGTGQVTNAHYSSNFAACGHSGYTPCHQLYDFAVMFLGSSFPSWLNYGFFDLARNATTLVTAGAAPVECLPCWVGLILGLSLLLEASNPSQVYAEPMQELTRMHGCIMTVCSLGIWSAGYPGSLCSRVDKCYMW